MTDDYLSPEIIAGWCQINDQRSVWRTKMSVVFDYLDSSRMLIMKDEGDFIAQFELVRWAVNDFNYHADLLIHDASDDTDLRFDLLFGPIRGSLGSIADHAPKVLLPIYSLVPIMSTDERSSLPPFDKKATGLQSSDFQNWTSIIRQFFEPAYADAVAIEHGLVHDLCKVALGNFVEIERVQTTADAQIAVMDLASTCSSLATLSADTGKQYDHSNED